MSGLKKGEAGAGKPARKTKTAAAGVAPAGGQARPGLRSGDDQRQRVSAPPARTGSNVPATAPAPSPPQQHGRITRSQAAYVAGKDKDQAASASASGVRKPAPGKTMPKVATLDPPQVKKADKLNELRKGRRAKVPFPVPAAAAATAPTNKARTGSSNTNKPPPGAGGRNQTPSTSNARIGSASASSSRGGHAGEEQCAECRRPSVYTLPLCRGCYGIHRDCGTCRPRRLRD